MTERQVADHYTADLLEQKIVDALRAAGKDTKSLSSHDLEPFDNLHMGGRESVQELAAVMELRPGMRLLDVGSGLGGPARFFAEHGCDVVGIDLSQEFVRVAENFTGMLRLTEKASFQQKSALEMSFDTGSFDGAYMIHVGMNLADKAGVFREVARVLKPRGRFAIFDILRATDEELQFPLPWAVTSETSFVQGEDEYRDALQANGFHIAHRRSRRQFALDLMAKMRAQAAEGKPPQIGVHIVMGEQAPLMLKNVNQAIAAGKLEPIELVAVRS